jgi:hypothetical protein
MTGKFSRAWIDAELATCRERLGQLNRLLAQFETSDEEMAEYLKGRYAQWQKYKTGLMIVRDQRPEPGAVELSSPDRL